MLLITTIVEIRLVAGRSRTRAGRPHVSGRPKLIHTYHAALCRGLEKSLLELHGRGMARALHGMCDSNTDIRVNQVEKTPSIRLAAKHGRGTA
jgi:hypothetical protein